MDEDFLLNLKAALPATTPDIAMLSNYRSHLWLDCGPITRPMQALCSAYTLERMSLFIRKEDQLAIPINMEGIHRARVYGCLYKVSTDKLIQLDKWKENGVVFERKPIEVLVPFADLKENKNVQKLLAPVWFYQAKRPYWQERIEMHLPRYNISPSHPDYELAPTHVNDEPELNNHFRFNGRSLEIHRKKPVEMQANGEVHEYVKRKNNETVSQMPRRVFAEKDPTLEYCKKRHQEILARLTAKRKQQEKDGFLNYETDE